MSAETYRVLIAVGVLLMLAGVVTWVAVLGRKSKYKGPMDQEP